MLWPAYYVQGDGVTYERAIVALLLERGREEDEARLRRGVYTTESTSAAAIQGAETRRAEVVSTLHPRHDLASEDVEVLRRQVERYLAAAGAAGVKRIVV